MTSRGDVLATDGGRRRRTLAALARVVCPPEGLDDALVAATVDEAEAFIAVLASPTRAALGAVIAAIEQAPRLRGHGPFSTLAPEAAATALRELVAGPLGLGVRLVRDLIVVAHYEQPELRERVGYLPDPFIERKKAERLERWAEDIAAHQELLVTPDPLRPPIPGSAAPSAREAGRVRDGHELAAEPLECDVVVVGSGAGGGVIAAELSEAGLSVVVLEEGGHHPTDSFTTSTTDALRTLYREGGASIALGRTPIGYAEGRVVGGGTVVNGGMSFRASERVLAGWARISGDRTLVTEGLADEYARVERFLSVGPADAGSEGHDQALLRRAADRMGWRIVEDRRNHVHCGGCNVCTWGCPTGAKQSTLVSYLPRAMRFGATVWSGCRVDRVVMAGKRATGVQGRVLATADDPRERPFDVRARHVVLCAGAIQTPALLQRSRVGAPSKQIGRNLTVHPGASVAAVFDEPVFGWQGAHQSLQVRELEDEGVVMAAVNLPPSLIARGLPDQGVALGAAMDDYNRMVTAGVLVEDTGQGRVRAMGRDAVLATYALTDADAVTVVRSVLLLAESLLAAGAHTVHLPFAGREPVHTGDDVRRARALPVRPSELAASTVHLMGTARIGTDPLWAVCDPHGTVHETAGLSVADASLFPAPVGVNPMLTIMALATRVAGRIIDTW